MLAETRLADTQTPLTTTYTYEPLFGQVATITDPLDHTWTLSYDSSGHLTGSSDRKLPRQADSSKGDWPLD